MADTKPSAPIRIVRMKLSEQVLESLREMVRSGELAPGDSMPSERDLMDRFSVGRPAVREALQAMHTSGLITISQGERSRVNELSPETVLDQADKVASIVLDAAPSNLEHLKEARRMFELGVVRAAAKKATKDDVENLLDLYETQESFYRGDQIDVRGFIETDMKFHTAIADIVGNPILTATSSAMLRWLKEYHSALLHWSGREDITLLEHARVIDRIAANDPEGAVEEMRIHLDRTRHMFSPRSE